MKHSLAAMLAIATAAGFGGMAQAQTMATPGTAPSQGVQGTAPYNQNQSTVAPAYRTPGTYQAAPTGTATPAPQASTQPLPAMRQPTGMQPSMSSAVPGRPSRDEIRQVQEQLQAQGLYNGPIDGIVGRGTKRALAQFQQENGLPATATLDQQTYARLSGAGVPSMAPSTGASTAPMGTNAPIGTGTQSYTSPGTLGTRNTYTQPNSYTPPNTPSQPTTR
jgi:peptidoglycan hydrolase-like protein with peptidoglycan-binding domain